MPKGRVQNLKTARRLRRRTYTGCWSCRKRKVKCDEGKPECSACSRLGVTCTGYSAKLIWVEDDSQAPHSDGRRYIECESIRGNLPILQSDVLDYLITSCDKDNIDTVQNLIQTSFLQATYNPFTVFHTTAAIKTSDLPLVLPSPRSIDEVSMYGEEKLLFHHYVHHVATIMMPFEHFRNPWKHSYPAVALNSTTFERKALYNALLAHSAFNLAQLDASKQKMLSLATKYYNRAIRQLAYTIGHPRRQYADTLAVISTLMIAEVRR